MYSKTNGAATFIWCHDIFKTKVINLEYDGKTLLSISSLLPRGGKNAR